MRSLETSIHCVFIFYSHLSFIELLRFILTELGLGGRSGDRLVMIEDLNRYLVEQHRRGHIVVLLIDEAQNLSDETLEGVRLLSNLETEKEKLLQIVLIGQPELDRKLNHPRLRQLKQRVAVRCYLERLKEPEVVSYIEYRLKVVGYKGEGLRDGWDSWGRSEEVGRGGEGEGGGGGRSAVGGGYGSISGEYKPASSLFSRNKEVRGIPSSYTFGEKLECPKPDNESAQLGKLWAGSAPAEPQAATP